MEDRTFKQVVKGIKRSEKDVDKVLNAARMQRHERMSDRRFEMLCETIFYCVLVLSVVSFFMVAMLH